MSTPSHNEKVGTKFNLLPFGSHVGAPKIIKPDTSAFLQSSTSKFNSLIKQKFEELKKEMEELVLSYNLNEFFYSSEIRFEPIVGDTYFLYKREENKYFLSMIAPTEWKMDYICTIQLNTDGQWVLLNGSYPKK